MKDAILRIFCNDTRTTSYLNKRLELSDDEFFKAALHARPKNRQLLDLHAEFLLEQEIAAEAVADNSINILAELQEIFKTDSGTLARINKNAKLEEVSDMDLLTIATKARPSNAKLKILISEVEISRAVLDENDFNLELDMGEDEEDVKAVVADIKDRQAVEPTISIKDRMIAKIAENKDSVAGNTTKKVGSKTVFIDTVFEDEEDDFDEADFQFEREQDDEENEIEDAKIAAAPVVVKAPRKQKHLDGINVIETLRDIFANDSGTLKRVNNASAKEENSEQDIIEIALKARPKNVRLKTLINDLAEESELREELEDYEDELDGNEIIGDDSELMDEELCAKVPVINTPIPFIRNDNKNLTLFIAGDMRVINSEHPNFEVIIKKLDAEAWNDVFPLLDVRSAIKIMVHKKLKFHEDKLFYKGEELHGSLSEKILEMAKKGIHDIQPLMRFLNKLQKNPSPRARDELYGFLSSGKIPINSRGNILTYKRINSDWTDCHSGTIANKIGNRVRMERVDVDDNKHSTCSTGLHVCSYTYLKSFGGGRTVVCEVNPRDVVSIPTDYKNAKMRCCKYTVLKEVQNDGPDILSEKPVYFD